MNCLVIGESAEVSQKAWDSLMDKIFNPLISRTEVLLRKHGIQTGRNQMMEEQLEKIFNQLGRIADALETIQNNGAESAGPERATTALPASRLPDTTTAEVKTKPGRPKKAAETKPTDDTGEDMFGEDDKPRVTGVAFTEVDVRGFLRQVLDKKGWEVAEAILAKRKVKKVKDVKEADYAAVVAECQAVLK